MEMDKLRLAFGVRKVDRVRSTKICKRYSVNKSLDQRVEESRMI